MSPGGAALQSVATTLAVRRDQRLKCSTICQACNPNPRPARLRAAGSALLHLRGWNRWLPFFKSRWRHTWRTLPVSRSKARLTCIACVLYHGLFVSFFSPICSTCPKGPHADFFILLLYPIHWVLLTSARRTSPRLEAQYGENSRSSNYRR